MQTIYFFVYSKSSNVTFFQDLFLKIIRFFFIVFPSCQELLELRHITNFYNYCKLIVGLDSPDLFADEKCQKDLRNTVITCAIWRIFSTNAPWFKIFIMYSIMYSTVLSWRFCIIMKIIADNTFSYKIC